MITSFQKIEKIGEGTYGVVYKARNRATGKVVALKKIRPETENEGIPATTIREILLLRNLKHSCIVDLMEIIHNDNKMYLVFEYIENDLKRLIDMYNINNKSTEGYSSDGLGYSNNSNGAFPFKAIKKMSYQLATAVAFCHSKNIFHRDLKPQNILVDKQFNIKLADFGLGRAANIPLRSYTAEIITLWYRPPELLLGCKYYDASVDIWSLACIMVEMAMLTPLFMGDSEIDQLYKIFRILGTPNNKVWNGVENLPNYKKDFSEFRKKDLLEVIKSNCNCVSYGNNNILGGLSSLVKKMLVYDPLMRISADEALLDAFFEDMTPIYE